MSEITTLGKNAIDSVASIQALDKGVATFLKGTTTTVYIISSASTTNDYTYSTKSQGTDTKEVKVLNANISDANFYNGVVGHNGTWVVADGVTKVHYFSDSAADTENSSTYLSNGSVSTFWAKTFGSDSDSAISRILAGEMSLESVKSFVKTSNLLALYNEDCANYVSKSLDILDTYANSLAFSSGVTVTKRAQIQAAVAQLKAMCSDGKFNYVKNSTYLDKKFDMHDFDSAISNDKSSVFERLGLDASSVKSKSYTITDADAFLKAGKALLSGIANDKITIA